MIDWESRHPGWGPQILMWEYQFEQGDIRVECLDLRAVENNDETIWINSQTGSVIWKSIKGEINEYGVYEVPITPNKGISRKDSKGAQG